MSVYVGSFAYVSLLHGEGGPEFRMLSVESLVEGINLTALRKMVAIAPDGSGGSTSDDTDGDVLADDREGRAGGQDPHVPHVVIHAVVSININGVVGASLTEEESLGGSILLGSRERDVEALSLRSLTIGNESVHLQALKRANRDRGLLVSSITREDAVTDKAIPPVIEMEERASQLGQTIDPTRSAIVAHRVGKSSRSSDVAFDGHVCNQD